jgi:hypothetical protein
LALVVQETAQADLVFKAHSLALDLKFQLLLAVVESPTALQAQFQPQTHRSLTLVQVAVVVVKQEKLQVAQPFCQTQMVLVVEPLLHRMVAVAAVAQPRLVKTLSQPQVALAAREHRSTHSLAARHCSKVAAVAVADLLLVVLVDQVLVVQVAQLTEPRQLQTLQVVVV